MRHGKTCFNDRTTSLACFLIENRDWLMPMSRGIQDSSHSTGMVFCYQNCSDLLWKKNCSSDREKLLKFEAEGRGFAKFLKSLEQFVNTVKGGKIFGSRKLFYLVPGGSNE